MKIGKHSLNVRFLKNITKEFGFAQYALLPTITFIKTEKFVETGVTTPMYLLSLSFLCYEIYLEFTPNDLD
jgi:hypothetical protein